MLAATPIGNIADASPRLHEALSQADVVAAEDTRSLRDLARRLGISLRADVVSHHDHNEDTRAQMLVDRAITGDVVVVVSDAGMPTVADPGHPLVVKAAAAGVDVTALPGPSAVLMALAVSGLPTHAFVFEGFIPRKNGERGQALEALATEARTMVFFESPHRLASTLAHMAQIFGADRPAAVCRELTKRHEEVRRGSLAELSDWAGSGEVRGEMVVVVGGRPPEAVNVETAVAEVRARVQAGERTKDAARDVAQTVGLPVRDVYAAAIEDLHG